MSRSIKLFLLISILFISINTHSQKKETENEASKKGHSPTELLKAAKLEFESGHPGKALMICNIISRHFPNNEKATPSALILGAEILLRIGKPMEARRWTHNAIKRFKKNKKYQTKIAMLHRKAIAVVTAKRKTPMYHWARFFLMLQWSVRGIKKKDIHERFRRFMNELRRHWKDWDIPGSVKGGKSGQPPSGIGRIMDYYTAYFAKKALERKNIKIKEMDEVVELLKRRIQMLKKLWNRAVPNPRAQERFDKIMIKLNQKIYIIKKKTKNIMVSFGRRKRWKKKAKANVPSTVNPFYTRSTKMDIIALRTEVERLLKENKKLKEIIKRKEEEIEKLKTLLKKEITRK